MFGLLGREEDGHAAVDGADKGIGATGEDRESFQRAFRGVPAVPQAGHAKGFVVWPLKSPRNFAAAPGFPFKKGVGRDQAAAVDERVTKSRLFRSGFGAGVDALEADLGIFGPGGNQAPAEFSDLEAGRASPEDGGPVGRSDDGLRLGRDGNLFFADLGLFIFSGIFRAHFKPPRLRGSRFSGKLKAVNGRMGQALA